MLPEADPPTFITANSSASEFNVTVPELLVKFPVIVREPVFSIVKVPPLNVKSWENMMEKLNSNKNNIVNFFIFYFSEINFSTKFSNLEILSSCSLIALISTGTRP